MGDVLERIVARKALEVERRRRHPQPPSDGRADPRGGPAALRRGDGPPRVIAEVKFRSPSAGAIRPRPAGEGARVARGYEAGGAAAVSVLADRPGFGGSPLEVRRVAGAVSLPVLFKEFVLDPLQLDLAVAVGASMALLLVRVLDQERLEALVAACHERALEPVVEAADEGELERALRTDATIVGVNARDLRTFAVDPARAARLIESIPSERVAVYMSGVRDVEDMKRVRDGRADAALVGEGLMRAEDPGARLAGWLEAL